MTVIERHPKLDAPYKEGGNRLIDENLKRYLWTGLDYERYEVIKIIPQTTDFAAIVMKSRNTIDTPLCLDYCGTVPDSSVSEFHTETLPQMDRSCLPE